MFQNITQTYTLASASSEIALIFLGTFILGMTLGWLIKPSGTSKREDANIVVASPVIQKREDDLQMIEGVGPAIEKLLNKHGVMSFEDVIAQDTSGLEDILEKGGSRFKMHIPTTWPDQAKLANKRKWSELEEYQEILSAGK